MNACITVRTVSSDLQHWSCAFRGQVHIMMVALASSAEFTFQFYVSWSFDCSGWCARQTRNIISAGSVSITYNTRRCKQQPTAGSKCHIHVHKYVKHRTDLSEKTIMASITHMPSMQGVLGSSPGGIWQSPSFLLIVTFLTLKRWA